jgi:hypothetical protein
VLKRITCVTLTVLGLAAPAFAQECLHGTTETPDQAARRKEALTAARNVNNLEANQPGARTGVFLRHAELASSPFAAREGSVKKLSLTPGADLLPGWQLTLDVTADGYWFMVKDKTDPCGFAYISNHNGVIFNSEPIRPGENPAVVVNRE